MWFFEAREGKGRTFLPVSPRLVHYPFSVGFALFVHWTKGGGEHEIRPMVLPSRASWEAGFGFLWDTAVVISRQACCNHAVPFSSLETMVGQNCSSMDKDHGNVREAWVWISLIGWLIRLALRNAFLIGRAKRTRFLRCCPLPRNAFRGAVGQDDRR